MRPLTRELISRPSFSLPSPLALSDCQHQGNLPQSCAQLTLTSFSPRTDQVTCSERSKTDQFYNDSLNNASVYPYEGAPVCLPITSSPGMWHENHVEPGYFEFQTRGYLWRNEQGLPAPNPETCAGMPVFGGVPVGALSPSTGCSSPLLACHQPGFTRSSDTLTDERDHGMGHELIGCAAATPAKSEARFETILDICEAAGFQSMDSMAAEYYTALFPPNSSLAATQRRSRSRNLPELLDALYVASSPRAANETKGCWALDESERFRKHILRLASKILIDEVGYSERTHAKHAAEGRNNGVSSGGASTADAETARRDRWRLKDTVSAKCGEPDSSSD